MARNWITFRQAGMIVNALHGRDRYGRKIRKKQDYSKSNNQNTSSSELGILVAVISFSALLLFKPIWALITLTIILVFKLNSKIKKSNENRKHTKIVNKINTSNSGIDIKSFTKKKPNSKTISVSTENKEYITYNYQSAKTIYDASIELGTSMDQVRKLLQKAGINFFGNPVINNSQFEIIRKIHSNEKSREKTATGISNKFDFSLTQVTIELKKIDPTLNARETLSDDIYEKLNNSIKERAAKRNQLKNKTR
jgi:hypothetical protein